MEILYNFSCKFKTIENTSLPSWCIFIHIFTSNAFAWLVARNFCFVAFAIIFQTSGSLAIATTIMTSICFTPLSTNLWWVILFSNMKICQLFYDRIWSYFVQIMSLLTFGLKALGLRSKHCLIDFCRCFSCARLLKQLLQLQLLQNSPLAKQSQYLKWKW